MNSTLDVEDPTRDPPIEGRTGRALGLAGALILLGSVYVFSRSIGLDQSLWEDELYTAHYYVRGGPSAIFDPAAYISNNHVLYSLLARGLTTILGTSEVVLRLGSVIPASIAAVLMGYWLWRRYGEVAGAAFAALVILSPMHFNEFRQARGWGLALLGATIVLVASLEMQRADTIRWSHVTWFVSGALVGVWTIYALILPFAVHGLILLVTKHERVKLMIGAGLVLLGSAAFYWPLRSALTDPAAVRSGPDAARRDGFVTLGNMFVEPLKRLVAPVFELTFSGTLALVIALVLVVAGATFLLLRSKGWAILLQLLLPVLAVFLALGLRETAIWDRYVSSFLLHLLALASLGFSLVWSMIEASRTRYGLAVALLLVGLSMSIGFVRYARPLVAIPRENFKGATNVIDGAQPLLASYIPKSVSVFEFAFSSSRSVFTRVDRDEFYDLSCTQEGPAAFVDYPRRSEPFDTTCLESRAVKITLPQRRKETMNVWLIP